MIYLDNAASMKIHPLAAEEMIKVETEIWSNPSSLHSLGYAAKRKLDAAREKIAAYVGCDINQIYFTSGASEGNSWVLESLSQYSAAKGLRRIITTPYEHPSVSNKLKQLSLQGFEIDEVKITPSGSIDFKDLIKKVNSDVAFVCIMGVNNEVGGINNQYRIKEVICDIPLFSDLTQWVPHFLFDNTPAEIFTCSAHKFGGPRGVGFVYCKNKEYLSPLITGGKQEFYLRGGTENLSGICAMAVALEKRAEYRSNSKNNSCLELYRAMQKIDEIKFNTDSVIAQYSNIINFYVDGVSGEELVSLLNYKGIYCSSSSACSSGENKPSRALLAMGLSEEIAKNSIRFSVDTLTKDEIDVVVSALKSAIRFIREC